MINWDQVDELRSEVGEADFYEVVEIFLEEVDEVMERLLRSPDPATIEDDLHFLKGSAMNLGFDELGHVCQQGEKYAAKNNAAAFNLAEVISIYERSKTEFNGGTRCGDMVA